MASVKLVYFAWVREKIGKSVETCDLPADIGTVADLIAWLKTRGAEYAAAFENESTIRASIDHRHVDHATLIAGAGEIAFFPPVTGG